jgi:flagellar basal body P-ring protein FlgI
VEREVATQFESDGSVVFVLNKPDFTTANRVSEAIDRRFGPISKARDAASVMVYVPLEYAGNLVGFVSAVEELPVTPDNAAKVVVNERTGTVVMGGNVTIDTVAVAQGGLTVRIASSTEVSQPPPFSGGSTVITQNRRWKPRNSRRRLSFCRPPPMSAILSAPSTRSALRPATSYPYFRPSRLPARSMPSCNSFRR